MFAAGPTLHFANLIAGLWRNSLWHRCHKLLSATVQLPGLHTPAAKFQSKMPRQSPIRRAGAALLSVDGRSKHRDQPDRAVGEPRFLSLFVVGKKSRGS